MPSVEELFPDSPAPGPMYQAQPREEIPFPLSVTNSRYRKQRDASQSWRAIQRAKMGDRFVRETSFVIPTAQMSRDVTDQLFLEDELVGRTIPEREEAVRRQFRDAVEGHKDLVVDFSRPEFKEVKYHDPSSPGYRNKLGYMGMPHASDSPTIRLGEKSVDTFMNRSLLAGNLLDKLANVIDRPMQDIAERAGGIPGAAIKGLTDYGVSLLKGATSPAALLSLGVPGAKGVFKPTVGRAALDTAGHFYKQAPLWARPRAWATPEVVNKAFEARGYAAPRTVGGLTEWGYGLGSKDKAALREAHVLEETGLRYNPKTLRGDRVIPGLAGAGREKERLEAAGLTLIKEKFMREMSQTGVLGPPSPKARKKFDKLVSKYAKKAENPISTQESLALERLGREMIKPHQMLAGEMAKELGKLAARPGISPAETRDILARIQRVEQKSAAGGYFGKRTYGPSGADRVLPKEGFPSLGSALDKGYLEKRTLKGMSAPKYKKVNPLLVEHVRGIANQSRDVANMKLAGHLAKSPMVSPVKRPGYVQFAGPWSKYGALAGLWADKNLVREVEDRLVFPRKVFGEKWGQNIKGAVTALNPPTAIGNIASTPSQAILTGVPLWRQAMRAPGTLKEAVQERFFPSRATKALAAKNASLGLVSNAPEVEAYWDMRNLMRATTPEDAAKAYGKIAPRKGGITRFLTGAYQKNEELNKRNLFRDLMKRNPGMSERKAAEIAQATIYNYQETPALSRMLTRGILSPFMFLTYPAKNIPQVVKAAIANPWGIKKIAAGLGALNTASSAYMNMDPEWTKQTNRLQARRARGGEGLFPFAPRWEGLANELIPRTTVPFEAFRSFNTPGSRPGMPEYTASGIPTGPGLPAQVSLMRGTALGAAMNSPRGLGSLGPALNTLLETYKNRSRIRGTAEMRGLSLSDERAKENAGRAMVPFGRLAAGALPGGLGPVAASPFMWGLLKGALAIEAQYGPEGVKQYERLYSPGSSLRYNLPMLPRAIAAGAAVATPSYVFPAAERDRMGQRELAKRRDLKARLRQMALEGSLRTEGEQ